MKRQLEANGHLLGKSERVALEESMASVRRVYEEYQQHDEAALETEEHVERTIRLLEHMFELSELYIKLVKKINKRSSN